MRHIFLYTFFISSIMLLVNACQTQHGSEHKQAPMVNNDSIFEIQITGLPPDEKTLIYFDVAKKYGVKYTYVAGCIVSDSLQKAVSSHNEKAYAQVSKKLGNGWEWKIQAEADSIYKQKLNK